MKIGANTRGKSRAGRVRAVPGIPTARTRGKCRFKYAGDGGSVKMTVGKPERVNASAVAAVPLFVSD